MSPSQSSSRSCPHCGIAEVPCLPSRGGSNGVTASAIDVGIALMAQLAPERTPQQQEHIARALINGVRHHLVQRHLYDAVVRELRPQNDREPRSGGSAAGSGASRLHDKPAPAEAVRDNPQAERIA